MGVAADGSEPSYKRHKPGNGNNCDVYIDTHKKIAQAAYRHRQS